MVTKCALCLVPLERSEQRMAGRRLHGSSCLRESHLLQRVVARSGARLTPSRLSLLNNPDAYLCAHCKSLLCRASRVS